MIREQQQIRFAMFGKRSAYAVRQCINVIVVIGVITNKRYPRNATFARQNACQFIPYRTDRRTGELRIKRQHHNMISHALPEGVHRRRFPVMASRSSCPALRAYPVNVVPTPAVAGGCKPSAASRLPSRPRRTASPHAASAAGKITPRSNGHHNNREVSTTRLSLKKLFQIAFYRFRCGGHRAYPGLPAGYRF